jgi:DNA-binding response OmpR family regulator
VWKIALVDPDPDIVRLLQHVLNREGYVCLQAANETQALHLLVNENPDALVVDYNVGPRGGLHLLSEIRKLGTLPVILLGADAREETVVCALEMGADDYVQKPFSPQILVARLQACLRRYHALPDHGAEEAAVQGAMVLNPDDFSVEFGARRVRLSPTEFRLLRTFVQHPGITLSFAFLAGQVWADRERIGDEVLRVTVHRLRQKLGMYAKDILRLVAIPGNGYRLESVRAGERLDDGGPQQHGLHNGHGLASGDDRW